MKRILSLVLCTMLLLGVVAGSLVSCSSEKSGDKGAEIKVYISSEITNLDPALAYTNAEAVKILGLLFDGLFKINSNGKAVGNLAKEWEIKKDVEENSYIMEIELNETFWSDGRQVSADDVVFSFKRILDPEFSSEAASMLYVIKNARAVKMGDTSIDSLGVVALSKTLLQIQFEYDIDYDKFMETLASPALVPLREDLVTKNALWATKPSTMASSGPFKVTTFSLGKTFTLERNMYYYRDLTEDALMKSVTPYRLVVEYSDTAKQLDAYLNKEIYYNGDLPLDKRAEYADQVQVLDLLSTHTYYFNTNVEPFNNANVRKALSLALDRQAIADLIVYASPATGLVSHGVFETTSKTSFRNENSNILATSGDLATAKSMLAKETINNKSFTLTYRDDPVDEAIAEYVKDVWGQLGFKVTLKALFGEKIIINEEEYIQDTFMDAYRSGDFDVIAIDLQMLSTDAFSSLAPFASAFSGNAMDLTSGDYSYIPHITGYNAEEYNALIETIYNEKDATKRVELLHQAEQMLLDDMPIIPLIFNKNAYLVDKDELAKLDTSYYGYSIFTKAKLTSYKYEEPEE